MVVEIATGGGDHRSAAREMERPVQIRLLVEGEIEVARLRLAWQKVAESWSVIESWQRANGNGNAAGGRGQQAPWQEHDLRGLPRDEARKWIRSFLDYFLPTSGSVSWSGVYAQR
jgi:hypothetical protein